VTDTLSRKEREELEAVLRLAQEQSQAGWRPSTDRDPFATCVDRRAFLRGGAALAGGLALASFPGLAGSARAAKNDGPAYGPLHPAYDEATGLPLLHLPLGFRYFSYGWTGDPLDDRTPTPALHDGMAIIREFGRWLVLCRNHEVGPGSPFTSHPYSTGAGGGTTNLVFDLKTERFVSAYATLSGTVRNCAGGLTPWGTWLTCEETTTATAGKPHGYVYDVGPLGGSPIPLKRLGRFSHEAVAVDPRTGIVYETEDGPSWPGDDASGFYRFVPRFPGSLNEGGRLQMLKIKGQPQFDARKLGATGQIYHVEWVDVSIPDPKVDANNNLLEPSPFKQGLAGGGALFQRPEGCWYGDEKIYFLSTDGGPVSEGQVFVYDPKRETLKVIYASPDYKVLENPDNLVVTPDGSLLLCEDNSGTPPGPPNAGERLLFLRDGQISEFALNALNFTPSGLGSYQRSQSGVTFSNDYRQQEWAGAHFSPDGEWLFVNIQTPGVTFAITGPWGWRNNRRRGRDWEGGEEHWNWDDEQKRWEDEQKKKDNDRRFWRP